MADNRTAIPVQDSADRRSSMEAELDPAIRDALIKRAEAEAAQKQRDVESVAAKTREEEEPAKTGAAKKKQRATNASPTRSTRSTAGTKQQQQQLQNLETNEPREEEDEDVMQFVADQAGSATKQPPGQLSFFRKGKTAAGLPAKGSAMLTGGEDIMQQHYNTATSSNTALLQMATEINEAAKMEKMSGTAVTDQAISSTEGNQEQEVPDGRTQRTLPQRQQPSRPGAYMGTPGEAPQRADSLRFSLVGTNTGTLLPNEDVDPDESSTETNRELPNNLHQTNNDNDTTSNQQLAVANLVVEDPEEELTRPLADPVDLGKEQERQERKGKLKQQFIWFSVTVCIAAAIIVGAVVGTRKRRETVTQTANPTPAFSMEPSEVPSYSPTGALDLLFDSLPDHTLASIRKGSETPQWKAWRWLAEHQNITNLEEWRKQQLFALATFFYALEGENWNPLIRGHGWMDDMVEECDWFSTGLGYFSASGSFIEWPNGSESSPCTSQGRFEGLALGELQLSGFSPFLPPEIALLTSLYVISLAGDLASPLSSFLPTELYEMTQLKTFGLWSSLTGQIPTQLGQLNLTSLYLSGNLLSGPLHSELGQLTFLTQLWLGGSQFTGLIPSELGQLTALTEVDLMYNQLTGQVFSEVGLLTALTFLWLEGNQFTGQVLSECGLLTSLESINLRNNQLTGPMPSELGLLTSLEDLDFAMNQLSGKIPSAVGLLTTLDLVLYLNANSFTGSLPSEIGLLTSLIYQLHVYDNELTGQVPSELGQLTLLEDLNLSGNLLSGQIPSELALMTSLTSLYLHNNALTGPLPSQLNASMGLRLYGNQFSGTVPEHLCAFLWCDCTKNVSVVSTCADLKEAQPDLPGRFPGMGGAVLLNIRTAYSPEETSWVWQEETNVTGVWETLESDGPLVVSGNLHSSLFTVNPSTVYRLVVSDSYGDGIGTGWITLTAASDTVLYSFGGAWESFSKITVDIVVGVDGSLETTNTTT